MQDGSRAAMPLLEARRGWITRHTPLYHVQGPYKQKRKASAQPAQQRLEVMPAVPPPLPAVGPTHEEPDLGRNQRVKTAARPQPRKSASPAVPPDGLLIPALGSIRVIFLSLLLKEYYFSS